MVSNHCAYNAMSASAPHSLSTPSIQTPHTEIRVQTRARLRAHPHERQFNVQKASKGNSKGLISG